MKCQQVQESLGDHSVGLLDADALSAFEQHLAMCAECARSQSEFLRCMELLDHVPRPAPPADLWIGMRARLDLERSLSLYASPASQPAPPPVASWWSSTVAAMTGFAAAAGMLVLLSAQPNSGPASVASVPPVAVSVSQHSIISGTSPVADGASMIAADGVSLRSVTGRVGYPNVIVPGRELFGDPMATGGFGSAFSRQMWPGAGRSMDAAGDSRR